MLNFHMRLSTLLNCKKDCLILLNVNSYLRIMQPDKQKKNTDIKLIEFSVLKFGAQINEVKSSKKYLFSEMYVFLVLQLSCL